MSWIKATTKERLRYKFPRIELCRSKGTIRQGEQFYDTEYYEFGSILEAYTIRKIILSLRLMFLILSNY